MFSTTTVLSVAIVLLDQVWCLGLVSRSYV
jgi:hypothetical protein